ncbi:MAG: PorV/PorQ family protein [Bacteroidota bacterium]
MTAFPRLALLLLAALLIQADAWAQSKTGTTIGQVLLIEPSARLAAMGNTGAVAYTEAMAAYYNPGALGFVPSSQVQFTHSSWLAGITYDYATVALQAGANTLMLSLTALNSGDIDVTEPRAGGQSEFTGRRYSVTNLAFGVGIGRRLTDRFSAGVHVKLLRESIDNSQLTALAVDFGVIYQLPRGATLGASLANFGTRGRYDGLDLRIGVDQDPDRFGDPSNRDATLFTETYPLPIYFRVGLGLPVQLTADQRLSLAVDAFQPSDNTNSVSLGGEWAFRDLVMVRAGYQNLFLEDQEGGLTFGGGLQYAVSGLGFSFDYAWNDFGTGLGNTQRFTFGFAF